MPKSIKKIVKRIKKSNTTKVVQKKKNQKKVTKKIKKISATKKLSRRIVLAKSKKFKVGKNKKSARKPIKKVIKKVVRKTKKLKNKPKKVERTKKLVHAKALVKSGQNPIILPRPENEWEAWQTFNPGVILLEGKIYILYRAIGPDGVSRLGYAVSSDGFTIDERLSYPVYEHKMGKRVFNIHSFLSGGSWGGSEDPRLVRVDGEDVLYMTYTVYGDGLRVGLTAIKVDDFLNQKWEWKSPALISPPDEVHKNWVIFPEKINGKYAILHSIKPKIQIEYVDNLDFDDSDYIDSFHGGGPQEGCWDKWLRAAGAPPLKTRDGWLLFYHAMDDDQSKYKVGVALLALDDPTKILYRAKAPVLEPEESYENNGFKPGIVYVSGAIIKGEDLLVYYGCSDSYIGVAHTNLNQFLEALKKDMKPEFKLKNLKK